MGKPDYLLLKWGTIKGWNFENSPKAFYQLLKIMKRKLIRTALVAIAIVVLSYGFTEGMEWHRLASCMIGGLCIGTAMKI